MTVAYVIEDNVPLPKGHNNGGRPSGPQTELGRALLALQPGQSIALPTYEEFRRANAHAWRNTDRRFATRKIAGQGWRVWRVA